MIPCADDRDLVLGQATCIRKLLTQVADLNAVVFPSGGSDLLVGAIAVCKAQGVRVYAAEPKHGGPGLAAAMRSGQRTRVLGEMQSVLSCLRGEAN
jgi:threonine dehydratase